MRKLRAVAMVALVPAFILGAMTTIAPKSDYSGGTLTGVARMNVMYMTVVAICLTIANLRRKAIASRVWFVVGVLFMVSASMQYQIHMTLPASEEPSINAEPILFALGIFGVVISQLLTPKDFSSKEEATEIVADLFALFPRR